MDRSLFRQKQQERAAKKLTGREQAAIIRARQKKETVAPVSSQSATRVKQVSTPAVAPQRARDVEEPPAAKRPKADPAPSNQIPLGFFDYGDDDGSGEQAAATTEKEAGGGSALPEGFFDDKKKDADARGVEHITPEMEFEDFQKSIRKDLEVQEKQVEIEEEDAAVVREQELAFEQNQRLDTVSRLKQRQEELKARKADKTPNQAAPKKPKIKSATEEAVDSDEDSDEEELDDLLNDWRAKRI